MLSAVTGNGNDSFKGNGKCGRPLKRFRWKYVPQELQFFDPAKLTIIECGASSLGLAVVISQQDKSVALTLVQSFPSKVSLLPW